MKKTELEKLDKLLSKFSHLNKSPDAAREIKEVQYWVQNHITNYETMVPQKVNGRRTV